MIKVKQKELSLTSPDFRNYSCILLFSLLCLIIAWAASADDVLVKVDLESDLAGLPTEDYKIRFCGKSFLLVQGEEDQLEKIASCILLDKIEPDVLYYLARVGQNRNYLAQVEKLGHILLELDDSVLVRVKPSQEPGLKELDLQTAPLPESIRLYPQEKGLMAPRIKNLDEAAFEALVIDEVVSAVSADEIKERILDLQENRDLDPPYTTYRSRYCLRVKQTDDPSDDACDNAAEYIFNEFKSYGLDVEYDSYPHEVIGQGHYQMQNVIATLPGKGANSKRIFVICAHYDSVASKSTNWNLNWKSLPAPGADDNASGIAAVLESARILSQYEFDSTIKFIAFSGEELYWQGSQHYVKLAVERGDDIAGALNFDMIAYDPDTPDIDIVANPGSEWLADAMLSIQEDYNISSLILRKIVNPEMIYSDHFPFWSNGYHAISGLDNSDFHSSEFYPFMHTAQDTIDKLNIDIATRMVRIAAGTLATLADPIGSEPHPDLTVSDRDIILTPENPHRGQPIQLTVYIHNNGSVDVVGALVQIWVTEPLAQVPRMVDEKLIDIKAGETTQISTSLSLTEWGESQVMVRANADYRIFETNGGNNFAVKSIRIGSESLTLGSLSLYPNPLHPGDKKLNIVYSLSKDADAALEIYSVLGELIYSEYFKRGERGGKFGPNDDIEWDCTNSLGEKVSSGIYFCRIIATDALSTENTSRKFLIIR